MDLDKMTADDFLQDKGESFEYISDEEVDKLLHKIGPEGLHEIANKLIAAADKDMHDAMTESYTNKVLE